MKILSFGNKNQIHFCHYSGTIHKLYMQGQLNENLKLIYGMYVDMNVHV